MADVGQRVVRDLRNALFRHILGQSAGFFARRTTGQLMSRINNDVGQVQQAVSETIGDLARESLALVGYAALMFYYDARLAIVCMTGAPLIVYPLVRLGQRVRRTTRRSQEALEQLSHSAPRRSPATASSRRSAPKRTRRRSSTRAGYQLFRTNMKVTAALVEPAAADGVARRLRRWSALLWYGSTQIAAARLTTGRFLASSPRPFLMYGPAKKLSRVNANLQQAIAASRAHLRDARHAHRSDASGRTRAPLAPFRRAIEFRDVGFGYDDGPPSRFCATCRSRSRPARWSRIVGRSGAGKTTLVNLLPRFYDVDRRRDPDRRRRHPRRHAGVAARSRSAS